MTTTLTFGATTIEPYAVEGWEQRRPRGATAHELVGGDVDYTHAPRKYRVGTFKLVFDVEADVVTIDALLATEPYFDLASDEATLPNGRFVPVGDIPAVQHDELRDVWLMTFDASEDDGT